MVLFVVPDMSIPVDDMLSTEVSSYDIFFKRLNFITYKSQITQNFTRSYSINKTHKP